MTAASAHLKVRVSNIWIEALDVASFELRPASGDELPSFTAGAHINVHLPGSMTRSYSLLNDQCDKHRYVVAVRRDEQSRGGSVYMHDCIAPGSELIISSPRNSFPLVEDAKHVVFIAGGIGITPIWAMVQRLKCLARSWELHYCAKTHGHAAFYEDIKRLSRVDNATVNFYFGESNSRKIGISSIVERADSGAHLYCCGPIKMMRTFAKRHRSGRRNRSHGILRCGAARRSFTRV